MRIIPLLGLCVIASVTRAQVFQIVSFDTTNVTWESVSGLVYVVEGSTNLAATNWFVAADVVTASQNFANQGVSTGNHEMLVRRVARQTYSGRWTNSPAVQYSCANPFPGYSLLVTNLLIVDAYPQISIQTIGPSPAPCVLSGLFTNGRSFSASCFLPAGSVGCSESYSITGRFDSVHLFTATFRVQFSGTCLDCINQAWAITGTR